MSRLTHFYPLVHCTAPNCTILQEKRSKLFSKPCVSLEEECLTIPALRTVKTTTTVQTVTSVSALNFPRCVRAEEDQRRRGKRLRRGWLQRKLLKPLVLWLSANHPTKVDEPVNPCNIYQRLVYKPYALRNMESCVSLVFQHY